MNKIAARVCLIFLLLIGSDASATEQSRVKFFCKTQYQSCPRGECDLPILWPFFFETRHMFSGLQLTENYVASDRVSLPIGAFPVAPLAGPIPSVGATQYAYVIDGPEYFLITIYGVRCGGAMLKEESEVFLSDGRTCFARAKDEVNIDRKTGTFFLQSIHTDGSIKDTPIGKPYSVVYGRCDAKIDRKF